MTFTASTLSASAATFQIRRRLFTGSESSLPGFAANFPGSAPTFLSSLKFLSFLFLVLRLLFMPAFFGSTSTFSAPAPNCPGFRLFLDGRWLYLPATFDNSFWIAGNFPWLDSTFSWIISNFSRLGVDISWPGAIFYDFAPISPSSFSVLAATFVAVTFPGSAPPISRLVATFPSSSLTFSGYAATFTGSWSVFPHSSPSFSGSAVTFVDLLGVNFGYIR